jgi:hypothetical protein
LVLYATTDDLFIALHQRMTNQQLLQLQEVLAAENPLHALWDFQSSWGKSALGVEFIALSNHRKSIQDACRRFSRAYPGIGHIIAATGGGEHSDQIIIHALLIPAFGRSPLLPSR